MYKSEVGHATWWKVIEAEGLTWSCLLLVQGPKEASGEQSSGSVFCFEGSAAAVAAKSSQPVDLMAVAARLDAGAAPLQNFVSWPVTSNPGMYPPPVKMDMEGICE